MHKHRILTLALLLAAAHAIAADWQTLFDGKTLEGWRTNSERGCWSVKDGCIVGEEDAEKLGSYLETAKEYKDFVFECEAKWNDVADSGFMFRGEQRIHVNIGMSPSVKRMPQGNARHEGRVPQAAGDGAVI